jgi:hypothetical protein
MENNTKTGQPLIYERIAAIMAEVPAIGKNNQNQEQRYRFRGIDDVYNSLHPLFVKHQVFTTSEILNKNREVWTNKNGTIMIEFTLQVKYRFTTIDGSLIETETMGQAMDSSDKSSNKAMSMAHKTAILQIFMIPTVDIEDADSTSPEPQAHGYRQPPSQQQSEQRPAASTEQNGYSERARQPQEHRPPIAPQQQQQNGYNRNSQQPNDRPASAKSLQYLRDLSARPRVTEADATQIEYSIQQGLSADQCSGLIDSINAFLQGHRPNIFQEADTMEPQLQKQNDLNDLPF